MPSIKTIVDTNEDSQWPNDVFERRKYSIFLTKLLATKEKPFVLNINAEWGAGKTFFLTNWYNDVKHKHPAVLFNAWENDYADDPLLSVVSAINSDLTPLIKNDDKGKQQLKRFIGKSGVFLKAVAPIIAKGVTAKLIGKDGVEELSGIVEEDEKSINEFSGKATEEFLKLFKNSKKSIVQFKKDLSSLIKQITKNDNISLPLFIFIDELDRCRPTFAVETLERIKHLFGVPEVVFIIATDTEQLSHSVKAIYGESFEGRVYLRRFFNQEYSLPDPSPIKFSEMLFRDFETDKRFVDYTINPTGEAYIPIHFEDKVITEINNHTITCKNTPNCDLIILFTMFSLFFSIDLRTQKQCYEKFEAVIINGKDSELFHSAYLFFLISLEAKKPDMFKDFFNGHTYSERERVLKQLGESPVNFRSHTELITAQQLIRMYLHNTLMTKDQLRGNLHNQSSEMETNIVCDILNNYEMLSRYKSKVELVGALS